MLDHALITKVIAKNIIIIIITIIIKIINMIIVIMTIINKFKFTSI